MAWLLVPDGMGVSEAADLLVFSCTIISRVYRERFLLRHSDVRIRIECKQHENMDPSCLVSKVKATAGGLMV